MIRFVLSSFMYTRGFSKKNGLVLVMIGKGACFEFGGSRQEENGGMYWRKGIEGFCVGKEGQTGVRSSCEVV